ncbi:hypothetical protein R1sor_005304 [Riccia sorocarpa]|uniref:Uncharacterized protein n=1 Tax=Riccia sorocarpa TaxID=122646 RepID=A0ABD3HJ44_9MARC
MLKADSGRGRKREDWSIWLYPLVLNEFRRLRAAGLKFSPFVLKLVAQNVLQNSPHPIWSASFRPEGSNKPLIGKINKSWIQSFQDHYSIVLRQQTGKLSCSPAKQEFIDRSIAYHLGRLCKGFQSGELDENLQENADETHFVINMDNSHTLGFRGDENVKYADVVSGRVSMTMVVKVTGGRSARISSPFMIFQNDQCSYPIRGVPDNVPDVSYSSTKKSFMTTDCLVDYYNERRANWAGPGGATKVQWIDNVSSHNLTPEVQAALDNIRTQMIVSGDWQGGGGPRTSGLLKNPGKTFFLKMAAAAVDEVNRQRTKEIGLPGDADYLPPMTYARKAVILCGLSLNTNGQRDKKQLSTGLQTIISRYRSNFMGSREGLVTSFDSNACTLDPEQVNIPDSQCAHGSS